MNNRALIFYSLFYIYEQLRFDILLHLYFVLYILHLDSTYDSKASDLISLCLLLITMQILRILWNNYYKFIINRLLLTLLKCRKMSWKFLPKNLQKKIHPICQKMKELDLSSNFLNVRVNHLFFNYKKLFIRLFKKHQKW